MAPTSTSSTNVSIAHPRAGPTSPAIHLSPLSSTQENNRKQVCRDWPQLFADERIGRKLYFLLLINLSERGMTMAENMLSRILRDATSLPPEQQQLLIELLTTRLSQALPQKTIEQIATEQGKSPLNFDEIRNLGSFFPEDDSVNDLINTLQSLRRDKSSVTRD
jgi:hypothetical protein